MRRQRVHIYSYTQSITPIDKWSRLLILPRIFCFLFIFALLNCLIHKANAIEPPFQLPSPSELARIKSAVIMTSKGKLTFELYPDAAPWHVANFKFLADQGVLRGRAFHILIDDFIIQGGRNNNPDFRYLIPAEFNEHKHEFGALGMARAADYLNPQRSSSSTQFHMLLREASNMDGSYTVFGKLIKGEEVLESLKRDDRIIDLVVYIESDQPERQSAKVEPPSRQSSVRVNDFGDAWVTSMN